MLDTSRIVAFVATTKPDDARDFYERRLGLTLVHDDRYALVFDANGTTLRVAKVPSFTPAPFTVLGWQVADLAEALAGLTRGGIVAERYSFLPQDDRGVCTFEDGTQVVWFKDPDGNTLSIAQAPSSS